VGSGASALLAGASRAGRREEGGGAGGTTNVLASTASDDVQPRAWWIFSLLAFGVDLPLSHNANQAYRWRGVGCSSALAVARL
jgi:hypothetical protein